MVVPARPSVPADAVVADVEADDLGIGLEREGDLAGASVPDGIVDGFLGDAEEVGGAGIVGEQDGLGTLEGAGDAVELGCIVDEQAEGVHEAVRFGENGVETSGELADLGPGEVEQLGEPAGVGGLGQRFLGEFFLEDAGEVAHAGELLAEAVVEVLADAGALAFGDFEELAFEFLAAGDLAVQFGVAGAEFGGAFAHPGFEGAAEAAEDFLGALLVGDIDADAADPGGSVRVPGDAAQQADPAIPLLRIEKAELGGEARQVPLE